jgi:hypothetical protein
MKSNTEAIGSEGNSKSQILNSKQIPSHNTQILNRREKQENSKSETGTGFFGI